MTWIIEDVSPSPWTTAALAERICHVVRGHGDVREELDGRFWLGPDADWLLLPLTVQGGAAWTLTSSYDVSGRTAEAFARSLGWLLGRPVRVRVG